MVTFPEPDAPLSYSRGIGLHPDNPETLPASRASHLQGTPQGAVSTMNHEPEFQASGSSPPTGSVEPDRYSKPLTMSIATLRWLNTGNAGGRTGKTVNGRPLRATRGRPYGASVAA